MSSLCLLVYGLASCAGDCFHQLSVQFAELGSTMVSYNYILYTFLFSE